MTMTYCKNCKEEYHLPDTHNYVMLAECEGCGTQTFCYFTGTANWIWGESWWPISFWDSFLFIQRLRLLAWVTVLIALLIMLGLILYI